MQRIFNNDKFQNTNLTEHFDCIDRFSKLSQTGVTKFLKHNGRFGLLGTFDGAPLVRLEDSKSRVTEAQQHFRRPSHTSGSLMANSDDHRGSTE